MIGQAISFFIFVVFCMKYVWPPVMEALRERQKKIADGLDAADRASRDLELAQEKAAKELREAKQQAAELIEQANKRSNQIVEEAKDQARAEGDRLLAAAKAEIEQESNRAKEALRAEISKIALAGAEKILETSIDEKAHAGMLNKLAAEF
ncbi:F0F1 ATP synthase subunit B [Oleiphilus messinensis]|uniref:ATP synthase subunit b n=2 Tax=Oleiphilus messinensis TaxID=141451 RepID=A0A1Y0IH18_9GAMM|nr:F0F1 ATP synthase subunit B [Oleiphilus messinensis]